MSRRQGRRVGLSREAIIAAAIELADQHGLPAVSMRRLAAELDVEPMTLYHYVPNKEALFDGMVEDVVASSTPAVEGDRWQPAMRNYAARLLEALRAHPGIIPLLATRPALTPGTTASIESVLAAMHDDDVAPADGLRLVQTLTGFVVGQAVMSTMTNDADSSPSADIDWSQLPLLSEAMAAAPAQESMFTRTVEALLAGTRVDG